MGNNSKSSISSQHGNLCISVAFLNEDIINHYENSKEIWNFYMNVSNCKHADCFWICLLIKIWYNTLKSDKNWHSCEKIVTFCNNVPKTVNLLKTVKITYFCHQKWKNSTLIDKILRTLPVFIQFWCFIPFWNQETKQITMEEYSRKFSQIRLIPMVV